MAYPYGGLGIPLGLFFVCQPVDGGENGFAADGVGVDREGLLGLFGGLGVVVVFERETGQQFLGFDQLGIGFERFSGEIGGRAFEVSAATSARPSRAPAWSFFNARASSNSACASSGWARSRNRRPQRTL